jgi:hypothetical protein
MQTQDVRIGVRQRQPARGQITPQRPGRRGVDRRGRLPETRDPVPGLSRCAVSGVSGRYGTPLRPRPARRLQSQHRTDGGQRLRKAPVMQPHQQRKAVGKGATGITDPAPGVGHIAKQPKPVPATVARTGPMPSGTGQRRFQGGGQGGQHRRPVSPHPGTNLGDLQTHMNLRSGVRRDGPPPRRPVSGRRARWGAGTWPRMAGPVVRTARAVGQSRPRSASERQVSPTIR